MRYPRIICLVLFAQFGVDTAVAQTSERVLIPVYMVSVPGAHGSLWTTHLVARNLETTPVRVTNVSPACQILCGPGGPVRPDETVRLIAYTVSNGDGVILEVERAGALAFNLRAQDLSRQSETWGTEIPVVREHELLTTRSMLLNVPVSEGFRQTLRLYEIDGVPNVELRLRLYSIRPNDIGDVPARPDILLGERTVRLVPGTPSEQDRAPAYFQIGDLNQIAPLGDAELVLIEIEPVTPGLRYWAFVSVTNNATQHVTVITPQ